MGFNLVEGPLCKALRGWRFVGDDDAFVASGDEFEVFVVVFPDGEAVVEYIVDVRHHDVVEELEVHDHPLLCISFFVDHSAFDRGFDNTSVTVELIAEGKTVRQGVPVIQFNFS